jgi:hypothetical protein
LPQAGSERSYFRIYAGDHSYIATYGANIQENETFIYFSQHFHKKRLATPKILYVNADKRSTCKEDFGDASLLDKLEEHGYTPYVYGLYRKSLQRLALLQVKGNTDLNYKKCLTNSAFGKQAIMADLLYF